TDDELNSPPFRFTDGIAAWAKESSFGPWVLEPEAHPFAEAARTADGKVLTFKVPPSPDNRWAPSLTLRPAHGLRHAPEYVHVRHAPAEPQPNLNDEQDVAGRVKAGGFRAIHYKDFCADGWIEADCPQLRPDFPRLVP